MIRQTEHITRLQAGDDKRAVKHCQILDAKSSKAALKAQLAELYAQLDALTGASVRSAAYLVA